MSEYESTKITKSIKKSGKVINKRVTIHKHRKIWIETFGEVPEGHIIHHKDGNKKNNSLDNLLCISRKDHALLHWKERKSKMQKKKILDDKNNWKNTEPKHLNTK